MNMNNFHSKYVTMLYMFNDIQGQKDLTYLCRVLSLVPIKFLSFSFLICLVLSYGLPIISIKPKKKLHISHGPLLNFHFILKLS